MYRETLVLSGACRDLSRVQGVDPTQNPSPPEAQQSPECKLSFKVRV